MIHLWIVQLLGYPVLVWLIWVWLGLGERNAGDLVLSVAGGGLIVMLASWLIASALHGTVQVRRHYARAVVFVLLLLLITCAGIWLQSWNARVMDWTAIRISNAKGSAINPRSAAWIYPVVLWSVLLAMVAALLGSLIYAPSKIVSDRKYWAAFALLILAMIGVPWLLLNWIPPAGSLTAQTVSMVLRFALAYVTAVCSLLVFARIVRQMVERRTQSS